MTRTHTALLFLAAAAGLAAATTGPGSRAPKSRVVADVTTEPDHISAPQLAQRIMAGEPALRVFDLRSLTEFNEMHIPTAQHASIDTLLREPLPEDTTIVVYADDGARAAQAWEPLRRRGYRRVLVLREGLYEWIARVIEPRLALESSSAERAAFEQAAIYSRFFGGVPREGVSRGEVPAGYWNGAPTSTAADSRLAVAAIRRRGC